MRFSVCLLLLLPAAGTAGEPVYTWGTRDDPDRVYLYRDGRQIGGWCYRYRGIIAPSMARSGGRRVIPEVPAWFCRIVEKLHAKEPADDSRRLAKWRTSWPTAKRS
ncbi:MAG TPA: hypothetical protein VN641_17570 [Urbifossiella sp.]|nr:hypothetical protein [Urbifossiella sp.]